MDIKKAFTASFDELKKNKIVIVPFLISSIFPIILVFFYLQISGLSAVLDNAVHLSEKYDKEKAEYVFGNYNLSNINYTMEAVSYFTGKGQYREGLVEYFKKNGIFDDFLEIMNTKNIVLGFLMTIMGIAFSIYLACASYAAIMLSTKKAKINYKNATSIANKFFFRIVWAKILLVIIFIVPLALAGTIAFLLFYVNLWIGVLAVVGFIAFLFCYITLMGIRLLLVFPILFYDDAPTKESIKKAFTITKNSFKQLLIVFGIIYGISTLTGSIGITPLYQSFYNLILSESLIKSSVLVVLILFFILIWAFVSAFQAMFLFYSYIYFKKPRGE